jgi:hypothetical protein
METSDPAIERPSSTSTSFGSGSGSEVFRIRRMWRLLMRSMRRLRRAQLCSGWLADEICQAGCLPLSRSCALYEVFLTKYYSPPLSPLLSPPSSLLLLLELLPDEPNTFFRLFENFFLNFSHLDVDVVFSSQESNLRPFSAASCSVSDLPHS